MSGENAPHFMKQIVTERGSTPRSTTVSPLSPLLLGWSFPHTFGQPADLFNALYMRPTPFAILYNHLPGILQHDGRNCLISFTDLRSFPHTFQQPADLFDALYTPTPFTSFYNHLLTIHFRAKRSLLELLVFYKFLWHVDE